MKEINRINEILKKPNANLGMKTQKMNLLQAIKIKEKLMVKEMNNIVNERIRNNKKALIAERASIEDRTGETTTVSVNESNCYIHIKEKNTGNEGLIRKLVEMKSIK
jgi:hypothetical protein